VTLHRLVEPSSAPAVHPAGPVLVAGEVADAIVAAIREENRGAAVVDVGSYLRVSVPGACRVSRAAIERALGRPFHLPGDLERAMASFQGSIAIGDDEVEWSASSSASSPEGGAR